MFQQTIDVTSVTSQVIGLRTVRWTHSERNISILKHAPRAKRWLEFHDHCEMQSPKIRSLYRANSSRKRKRFQRIWSALFAKEFLKMQSWLRAVEARFVMNAFELRYSSLRRMNVLTAKKREHHQALLFPIASFEMLCPHSLLNRVTFWTAIVKNVRDPVFLLEQN